MERETCDKCGGKYKRVVTQVQLMKERDGEALEILTGQQLPMAAFFCEDCGVVEFYVSPAKHK